VVDEDIARQLMERAKADGVSLVGPGGLLSGLTKTVEIPGIRGGSGVITLSRAIAKSGVNFCSASAA
jgi:hypothetical protein